tara:strand:+ start:183 stop:437 length:255 start_codon:yes stop_codon:yes gene_type:complete
MKRFTVKEGDREQEVLIVGTEEEMKDKSQMDYLEKAYKEKTAEQLRNMPSKPKSSKSKKEISGALKEYYEYKKRKQSGDIRKYY